MIKLNRYIFRILPNFLVLFLFSSTIARSFSDDFTINPLGSTSWMTWNNSSISFENPGFKMSSLNSRSYPYMTTSNIIDFSSDKYFEITFQYTTASDWGVGMAFTDVIPTYPTNMPNISDYLNNSIVYVWGSSLHVVSSLCPNFSSTCPEERWVVYPANPPAPENFSNIATDLNKHTLSIEKYTLEDNLYEYRTYLDSKILSVSKPTSRIIKGLWIGNPNYLNNFTNWSSLKIFSVKTLQSIPAKPSSFPYLSQKSDPWGSMQYDDASSWAGENNSSIDRWGCALTSAAMILQKYDVKTPDGPSGSPVTPDVLNDWLQHEPDGYIGFGLLNWIAITRYARESHLVDHAPSELEYERSYLPTTPSLPTIIGTPGHFVVAYDDGGTDWIINDPADSLNKTLDKLSTVVKSFNNFVPSETDLSYMLFVTDPGVTTIIKNQLGIEIPIIWTEDYLIEGITQSEAPMLKIGMIAKPVNGKYIVTITQMQNSQSTFKAYLYDNLAQVSPQIFELSNPTTNFEIQYAKEPESSRKIAILEQISLTAPTNGSPNNTYQKTNEFDFTWDKPSETELSYEFQSSLNPAQTDGILTTGLWKSNLLNTNMIHSSGAPDGTWYWQVRARDASGNYSPWSEIWKVTIDHIAPTTPTNLRWVNKANETVACGSSLKAIVSGAVKADWDDSHDDTSGVVRYEYTSFNPPSGWPWNTQTYISEYGDTNYTPSNGNYGFMVRAVDLAGNISPWSSPTQTIASSCQLTFDSIAPTLTSAPMITNIIDQIWNWQPATDTGSGVSGYSYRTFDTTSQQYLSDWLWLGQVLSTSTQLTEGSWQLALRATDLAGNDSAELNSLTVQIDNTVPTIPTNLHFDNPSKSCGEFTNEKLITIDWDDASDTSGVVGYEYNINYPLGETRGSWTTYFTSSSYRGSLNEGIHYIKIRAKDALGNYSDWSNTCAITYDSTSPKLKEQTTFSGWHNTLQTSYFDFSDSNLQDNYMAPSCEIVTEGISQTCTVTPNVCDKAGNCYKYLLSSNGAKIDLTKPTVKLGSWGSTINGTAEDVGSGVDNVSIKIVKPDQSEMTVVATGTTSWSYTLNDSPSGDYRIYVTARDIAGNQSEVLTKEFVMSPPSQSQSVLVTTGSVQGTSTENIISPKQIALENNDDIVQETGAVLGEATSVKKTNYWWWLLLVPVVIMTAFIKRKK